MNYGSVGIKIREERLKLRMTQEKMSEKVGISPNFLGQIERGDRKASLETLVSIANVLGTSLDYLLGDNISITNDNITKETMLLMSGMTHKQKKFIYDLVGRCRDMF